MVGDHEQAKGVIFFPSEPFDALRLLRAPFDALRLLMLYLPFDAIRFFLVGDHEQAKRVEWCALQGSNLFEAVLNSDIRRESLSLRCF